MAQAAKRGEERVSAPEGDRRARARHAIAQIGTARLAACGALLLAALLLARFSWLIPISDDAERALYDIRATLTAPRVAQDPNLVMVAYTEETLAATGRRSPLDRALLARALAHIDAMRPKAIGIDIMIDQAQPEDAQLIAALRAMRTPTYLAFATHAMSPNFVEPWQEQFRRDLQDRLAGTRVRPASVNIELDPDGVVRHFPPRTPGAPPILALAMHPGAGRFQGYVGAIAPRQPRFAGTPVFATFPIDLVASDAAAALLTPVFQDRYVLVGADLPDQDRFSTPASVLTRATIPGLELQADLLAQALEGVTPVEAPAWALWVAAFLVVAAGAATGGADTGRWWLGALLAVQVALLVCIPLELQALGVDTRSVPMFGWIVAWILASAAATGAARSVGAEQRRFAQSALGKYLPRDIANAIVRDPERLSLRGEKREIFVVFTDLEGFTELSSQIEPEMVALLINRYLETMSGVVLEHGGTLDKFIGDAVVAFWGAPIARADDGERAVRAALAMHVAGEAFRRTIPAGVPPFGRTRVGVHRGAAIVGNFGGEDRIQYTAFGDSMNTASRLEGANKTLGSSVLVSADAAAAARMAAYRPMGRLLMRGRSQPLDVFEIRPGFPEGDAAALNAAYRRFDEGDRAALDDIAAIAARHAGDTALGGLVERLRRVGPGGAFQMP